MQAFIQTFFERDWVEAVFDVPYTAHNIADDVHEQTRVINQVYDENGVRLHVRGPSAVITRFAKRLSQIETNE